MTEKMVIEGKAKIISGRTSAVNVELAGLALMDIIGNAFSLAAQTSGTSPCGRWRVTVERLDWKEEK